MSFIGETIKIGDHDTVVGGVCFSMAGYLDTRLMVLRDTPIYVPAGMLGYIHNELVHDTSGHNLNSRLGWMTQVETWAVDCIRAAHIARAAAAADWRKIDTVERIDALAKAAGFLNLNGQELERLANILALAQLGDTFVPDWICTTLQEMPCFEAIRASLVSDPPGTLDEDLDRISNLAQVNAFLSLITRWPSIAPAFPSQSAVAGDMERRSQNLRLASAFLAVVTLAGDVACLATLKVLIQSLPFEEIMYKKMSASESERWYAKIDNYLRFDPGQWEQMAAGHVGPHDSTHLGLPVSVYRLPIGMYQTNVLQKVPIKGMNVNTGFYGQTASGNGAEPITASTHVHPELKALATRTAGQWASYAEAMANGIEARINKLLSKMDDAGVLRYALRDEGAGMSQAATTAVNSLRASSVVQNTFLPVSGSSLTPIISSVRNAESPIDTVMDLTETALVPEEVNRFEAKDLGRFIRTRAINVQTDLNSAMADPKRQVGTSAAISPTPAMLHVPLSPVHRSWAWHPLPLPYWETIPDAYMGSASNGLIRPLEVSGLADLMGTSVARFLEHNEALLAEGDNTAVMALCYSLARLGVVSQHKKPLNQAAIKQALSDLKAGGPLVHGWVHPASQAAITNMLWGDNLPQPQTLFWNTDNPVPLTGDGLWYLWPYTAVPVPGMLTDRTFELTTAAGVVRDDTVWPKFPLFKSLASTDGYLPVTAFGRFPEVDARSFLTVSVPAGVYAGTVLVMAAKKTPSGLFTRLTPTRFDVRDTLLWSTEEPLTGMSASMLAGRPGHAANSPPEKTYYWTSALQAEAGIQL